MLSLRERIELDLEARLMGETLVLNRSLDPLYGDYIELNDLNVPLELRRNQGDDVMPTVKEVVENMDGYRDQDMGDVIFGETFCKASCVEARRVWKWEHPRLGCQGCNVIGSARPSFDLLVRPILEEIIPRSQVNLNQNQHVLLLHPTGRPWLDRDGFAVKFSKSIFYGGLMDVIGSFSVVASDVVS
ncbi:hypothetical protein Tco_1442135, partial [Tanacetum coccineum]